MLLLGSAHPGAGRAIRQEFARRTTRGASPSPSAAASPCSLRPCGSRPRGVQRDTNGDVSSHAIDGRLSDWRDIADAHEWEVLLLGNGLSINVWDGFRYGKLFDHAGNAGLTPDDLAFFTSTPNFERVLADLNTAIRVSEVNGVDPRLFYQSYRRIQLALGHAIRRVHPHRTQVPDSTLAAIRPELASYEWVFTTSYDLIVYWSMGYGERYRTRTLIDRPRSRSIRGRDAR